MCKLREAKHKTLGGTIYILLEVTALGANQRMPSFIVGTPANAVCTKVMLLKENAWGLLERCRRVPETLYAAFYSTVNV